jgi:Ca-activated chloride channel family protein
VLVLVTDGQVGNEDHILQRISARLAGIRVHVVGIDRAVNAGFLGRLAAAGRGRCELVESEDRLDEAATRIHRRIGVPLVTDLALAADEGQIVSGTMAPSLQPDLFSGVPLVVTGRWRGHSGGTIAVTGTLSDGTPFQNEVAAATGGSPASTAAWARAHLRDLEDRYASLTGRGTVELGRLEEQITDVSLRFGVLCRFTAFVAVDSRVVTDGAGPHRVTQPVELPSGWQPTGPGQQPTAAMPLAARRPGAMAPMAAAAPMAPPPMWPRPMAGGPMTEAAMPPPPLMPTGPMPAAGPTGPMPTGGKRAAAMRARAAGRREPQVGDAPRLVEARRQMADEAAELRAVHDAPDSERARLLGDLATRIDALLAWLAGERAAGQLTGLAELVGKLRACDRPGAPRGAELDALWQEAIRVLTGFAGGADRGAPREWWKRTR